MKIDVCMPTWNSERFIDKGLSSIYRELDVNMLYVVDKFSSDNTIDIFKKYNLKYKNIKIMQNDGNLAIARQLLIENVGTDFFLFIDADVELKKDFMMKLQPYLSKNVGAVASRVELTGRYLDERYVMALEKSKIKLNDMRGYTYCTLIKKDAVTHISIPNKYYTLEDHYIRKYIEDKGYKWITPSEKLAIHYNDHGNWLDILKFKVNIARAYRNFYGRKSFIKHVKSFVNVIYLSLIASGISKDPRIFPYKIFSHILDIYGYITYKKEVKRHQDRNAMQK